MSIPTLELDNAPSENAPYVREFPLQTYYCGNRACDQKLESRGIPSNWYLVRRRSPVEANTMRTVAIVCSTPCLLKNAIDAITS